MSTYRLDRILAPRTLALVGGSPRPGSLGAAVLRNIRAAGFTGDLGIVNPYHPEIDGLRTHPSVSALPFAPDLIVVTTPAKTVPSIIAEAGGRGVAGAVILSAGLGHGENSLADAARRAARATGMRIVGPNCLGVMMPNARLNASFAAHEPRDGGLALISQSGAIAAAMVDWAAERAVGFSGIVSIGDQLDVDIADCLDYFALDQKTHAILLYMESVGDARKFMSAARAAARLKPVVVVKSGRNAQGARAAATHTGALAGADGVYDAAFRRAGLLRVFDLRELFACAEILGRTAPPKGKRLAILTNGGGLGILAIDRLVELGGTAAELPAATMARLDAALAPGWSKSNPVDIAGDAGPARYQTAFDILLSDSANDGVLVLNVETAVSDSAAIAERVATCVVAHRTGMPMPAKPVLAAFVGAGEHVTAPLDRAGVPHFPTEDDAIRAFMYLVHHRDAQEALTAVPDRASGDFEVDPAISRRIVETAIAEGRTWLDPLELFDLFESYGIPMVPTRKAGDAAAAVTAANEFLKDGIPVAVKVLSRDIVHKSDIGGVVLDLADEDAVGNAASRILANARLACPAARIDGLIVQPMIKRRHGRELIVGMVDDPSFGPVIAFGHGGTAVEVENDKALALPPLDMNLARDLLQRTAIARLLPAYRNVPPVKSDAVPLTLVRLSQMVVDLPEIRELDINPLLADETGVLALDARVAVGRPGPLFAGRTRLVIRPYPAEWCRDLTLKDGRRVSVRPIRPEDEPAIREFLAHIEPKDLRLRFFGVIKEFAHPFVARLTQLDYARAMAFVALDAAGGDIIGVVRLHSDSLYESAEYAILLRSDQKGRGLGWSLMLLLIEYARSEGLKRVTGEVLQENSAMLTMCHELGFVATTNAVDASIVNVSLDLSRRG